MVEITLKMPDESAERVHMPVQLPHKVLEYLITECGLLLDDKLVANYWSHLESVKDEVAMATKEFRRIAAAGTGTLCWPLGLHGDEAHIGIINNPSNKVTGVTLNIPLFRPKATRLSRWLLFVVESDRLLSVEETIFPVLAVITESLNHAIEHGVAGRRFILTELRGDQVWFRFIFKHKAYWIGKNICFRCRACTQPTTLNYLLNNVPGGWESTMRSTEEFINEELEEPYCSFAKKCNFCSWESMRKCTVFDPLGK